MESGPYGQKLFKGIVRKEHCELPHAHNFENGKMATRLKKTAISFMVSRKQERKEQWEGPGTSFKAFKGTPSKTFKSIWL